MAAPSLVIPVGADISKFQDQMSKTADVAKKATLAITNQAIKMSAGWLASQGAAGAATLAFGRMIPVIGQVVLAYKGVKGVIDLMSYSTELAKHKIEEFNKLAAEANASGFSTDFFQRISKAAGDSRDKISDLSEVLKKFNEQSTPKLNGSPVQQRLDQLSQAGNFTPGAAVSGNNSEERLRSTVTLIDSAMQKGERLAALDLTETAFGPKVAAALRADSGYLDDMLKRADAINKSQIISEDDIGRAIDLKARMEDAQKVLANKWKPVQDDLAKLGENYHESWVSITEDLAAAVGLATDLYSAIKKIPDVLADAGNSSFWKKFSDYTESLGLNSTPEGLITDPAEIKRYAAQQQLNARLQNPSNVSRSMQEASDVESAVRGDTSKRTDTGTQADTDDEIDRAINALRRHAERTEADTKAVGLGAGALAKYRAEAQESAAVAAKGGKETADQAAEFKELADRAEAAATALAKARVANQIQRGAQTALLSPEDVQIANQLKDIYPNVDEALRSVEASGLRANQALSGVSTEISNDLTSGLTDIVSGSKSAKDGFNDFALSVIKDIEQMIIKMAVVGPLMRSLQSAFSPVADFIGAGFNPVAGISGHATGGYISGPGSARSDSIPARLSNGEFVVNAQATAQHRGLLEAINGKGFAAGGYVGVPSVPAIASKGSGGPIVNVINQTSQPATATTQRGSDGSLNIVLRDMVRGVIADDASRGGPITGLMKKSVTGFSGS